MSETQLNDTLNRIAEQVEAIGGFVGRSVALQLATQHKLDALSETVNRMTERMDAQDEKREQHFNRMTERMDVQDEKWEQRLNLLTASSERQQASIDRMAASIESAAERQQISIDRMAASIERASIRQENMLAEYQKTAQSLIQLATAMMQQKAG